VNISAWIDLRYFLFKDLCSIKGAAGGRDTSDEDFSAVCFKDFFDATPVGDLDGGYGGTDGERVEAK